MDKQDAYFLQLTITHGNVYMLALFSNYMDIRNCIFYAYQHRNIPTVDDDISNVINILLSFLLFHVQA